MEIMPPFHLLNLIDSIKPGAAVLSFARTSTGEEYPALCAQRFGRGRALALAIGDLWRWGLRREQDQPRELEIAWRQTLRWLVADVPQRVEVDVQPVPDDPQGTIQVRVTAREATYEPLDNASTNLIVKDPDGQVMTLAAQPSDTEPGIYETRYVPAQRGAYRADATVTAADGSDVGTCVAGWTADPAQGEFASLEPQRHLFQQLAEQTGGEVISSDRLAAFVADLPNRQNVITQPWIYPFWHQWWIFSLAVVCLVSEWGLRRWKGLS